MGIIEYTRGIPKEKRFYYTIIYIACVWFFNVAYQPSLGFIVAAFTGAFYIYYDIEYEANEVGSLNTDIHYMLNSLLEDENRPPPEYFYIAPDMITFFYSIRDYRVYNRDSYVKAIKTTNNLLRLKKELGNDYEEYTEAKRDNWQNFGYVKRPEKTNNIKNLKEIFEMAEIQANKAVNYIHSFAIALPVSYKKKHKKSLDRFHLLTKRVLDDILTHCKKHSSDPLIGQDYGLAKPHKNRTTGVNLFEMY